MSTSPGWITDGSMLLVAQRATRGQALAADMPLLGRVVERTLPVLRALDAWLSVSPTPTAPAPRDLAALIVAHEAARQIVRVVPK